ncbi:MAG: hypothetical protein PWQ27_1527, partial [Kosmotoga sp.]|nr:hypothetical protein [Kosmotoga sp.]
KNDNCHVEQKNWSVVRRAVGYYRYDTEEEFQILKELYASLNLYNNHFQPNQKIVEKIRKGNKVSKKYDRPTTPYERIMRSPWVDQDKKDRLRRQHEALDIYKLKSIITHLQEQLLSIQIDKSKGGILNYVPLNFK